MNDFKVKTSFLVYKFQDGLVRNQISYKKSQIKISDPINL